MNKIIILIIVITLNLSQTDAQKLSLYRISTDNFPIVSSDFFVSDNFGKLIKGLQKSSFKIFENSIPRRIISIDCPSDKEPEAISSVLTFDISGSMNSGAPNIELVKAAGKIWVNTMPLGKSECGITSFNQFSFINQDFTTDKELLLKTIENFIPRGGTDYNEAFLSPLTGNIKIAKSGKAKKVIVFLTDGISNTNTNETEIIKQAKDNNIIIYCIAVGMRIPPELKNIALGTGGTWFEKVAKPQEIEAIYLNLLEKSQGGRPCEIQWESEYDCDSIRNVEISLNDLNLSVSNSYNLGSSILPTLEINPQWLSFGVIVPPQKVFKDFIIKAVNQSVEISNIHLQGSDFILETQLNYPYKLNQGESVNLRVSFQPVDTLFRYSKLTILSNACNHNFIILNAGARKEDDQYELMVISPNGGERIKAGSKSKIKWGGVPLEQQVDLYYTINQGFDWEHIGKDLNGNEYIWDVPDTLSEDCLIKVSIASNVDESIKLIGHSAKINSIEWGNDYNTILSAGTNGKSVIWNISQKKKINELTGHNGGINSISVNRNNLAASSGDDGTIRIWDLNNYTLSKTLYGHANKVSIAKWLASNNLLFSGSFDSDVRIWNVILGQSGKPLDNHSAPILSGDFSPDASFFVTGGVDKKLIFWDTKSNSYLSDISVSNDSINSIDWNKKGDLIACGFNDGFVDIYSSDTKTRIISFKAHEKSVKCLEFSPDGKHLATSSSDHNIKIWDTKNYELIKELRGHKESVNSIKWRNDGLKIASCSDDSTIIIWDFLVNSDISDSLWAITKPDIISLDFDLGKEFVGFYKDSVLQNYIKNEGNLDEEIINLSLSGSNSDEFEIVSPVPPFIVNKNSGSALEIRFKPLSEGKKTTGLIIQTATKTLIQNISAEAILPDIELLTNIVDFGAVPLGDSKQKIEAILKNKSSRVIEILSASISGPDIEQFMIINGNEPYLLQPGESMELKIEYKPSKIGKTSTEIEFRIANIPKTVSTLIFGEGLGKEIKISVEVKDFAANSGELVKIPLYLIGGSELFKMGINNISTTIKFNPTLLFPVETTLLGEIKENMRQMEINIPVSNADTIISFLNFISAWGNAVETDIIPENTYAMGKNLNVSEKSGKFKLLDICNSGGTRLFMDSSSFFLSEIIPNPSDDRISFSYSLIEDNYFELYLTDFIGRNVLMLNSGFKASGTYEETIQLKGFADGVYFLFLKNGLFSDFKKFVLTKN